MIQTNDKTKLAVIYARVSTDLQVNGTSLEGQLSEVRAWSEENGYTIVGEYLDEGESAQSVRKRAGFRRLLADIDALRPEAIICWKHSRLFRRMEDAILYKHLLLKKGVKLISVKEPIDDGPVGRLVEHILMALNEFYSANLAEETLCGLCETARQGYLTCKPLYGYRAIEVKHATGYIKHKAAIDSMQAKVIRQIYKWRGEGVPAQSIAKRLTARKIPSPNGGVWRGSTIHNILYRDREKYFGNLIYNRRGEKGPLNPIDCIKPRDEWIIVPHGLPAIITQEMANRIPSSKHNKRTQNKAGL